MLKRILGVQQIEKLYVELLFRCNFHCCYCYHGERLSLNDAFTVEELGMLVSMFKSEYRIRGITLLGGEPFLYRELTDAVKLLHEADLSISIISNGYRIQRHLPAINSMISELRISIDGLEKRHDRLRTRGSFRAVLDTLSFAKSIGISTSVTITVNDLNVDDVIPLIYLLSEYGVERVDAHCVRLVGDGKKGDLISSLSPTKFMALDEEICAKRDLFPIPIVFEDEDFHASCLSMKKERLREFGILDRFNIQANGEAYISCKFTGTGLNSFFYDKANGVLNYTGRKNKEIELLGL